MSLKHLAPLIPSESNPFDRRKAAHLLRRTGFGAPADEVRAAVERGLSDAVDQLFEENEEEEKGYHATFSAINGSLMDFSNPEALQAWWIYRMASSKAPLREKLTLFWHGHFATSHAKVEDMELMHRQAETLRRLALGSFREITLAMAKDPAMLVWLDGQSSTKEHPNENFARELMELFTCGIGHYTEKDVLEAARAFTGWHRDELEFVFHPDDHDPGTKQFLGKSGRFDGTDIVDILMQEPTTARFLARKLLRFFATAEPSEEVIDEAAALLDRTQLNIKWFLRELFLSRYFYSDDCYRKRISSPVEFVVGTVRTLAAHWPSVELVEHLKAMGQELFAPPNVKGWDGEQKWINSQTWAARVSFAKAIAGLESDSQFGPRMEVDRLVAGGTKVPTEAVGRLADVLMQDDLAAETTQDLTEFLVTTEDGRNLEAFRDDDDFRESRTRGAVALILSLPEYHTC
ncbi:MAG TPA: DUF1800 domain-containing protein [Isosphaeraceae bacterium]|jgi:hypothetical protein|nr:DUF1800 domain-containing protein [Isosphaeraceae bacterium]